MKKILKVICAFVCVVSFATANVVNAGTPSASQQERNAHRAMEKEVLIPRPEKKDVQNALSDVLPLQKRLSRVNGITITDKPFQHADDYKTMMHPVLIGYNGSRAATAGAGYIYISLSHLVTDKDGYIDGEIGMLDVEYSLSHEYGHGILGHAVHNTPYVKREYEADMKSFKLIENLPEGGWGCHLLGVNLHPNVRFEKQQRILNYIKKETNQVIGFDLKKCGLDIVGDPINHITVCYDSGEYTYPLVVSDQYSRNAYYGGQIAYCIAKGILSPKNLRIVPNTLKYELKWDADCLLVCNDSSLPNGYRILTGLKGSQTQLQNELNQLQNNFSSKDQANMGYYYSNTFGPRIYSAQGTEQGKLILWETMAVAYDFTHR